MDKKPDFIFFALARWDGPYSSTAISLARELSKSYRVFYIDNPFTVKDVVKGWKGRQVKRRRRALLFGKDQFCEIDSGNKNLIGVTPKWVLPINFLSNGFWYQLLSSFNDRRVGGILQAIRSHYQVDRFTFINCYNPFYFTNPSRIPALTTIYYCFDNIDKSKYVAKHGPRLEREMVGKYDLTLTTSLALHRKLEPLAKRVFCLPNAADFDLFNQAVGGGLRPPQDIPNDGRKIIGYIGHVDDRLDYDVLEAIADAAADTWLVLVGPVSSQSYHARLAGKQNVVSTGKKDIRELPSYVQCFDCCIIPFKVNELTAFIYPLKVNEYLAVGKPVVSTRFSEDIITFEDSITIASDVPSFVEGVKMALDSSDRASVERRVEVARKNSWSGRAQTLIDLLKLGK